MIYDWTGSYAAAFVHGIGWNLLNLAVVVFLLTRARHIPLGAPGAARRRSSVCRRGT